MEEASYERQKYSCKMTGDPKDSDLRFKNLIYPKQLKR